MTQRQCGNCFAPSQNALRCVECAAPLAQDRGAHSLPFGTILDGKFMVGNLLGEPGGFGIVYLCWDRNLQRRVVIKELFPEGLVARDRDGIEVVVVDARHRAAFELQRQLFVAEARKLAQFDGVPAIVKVTHYFAQNDTAYFAMPYLPGTSLARHVAVAGCLSAAQTLALFWPLAAGLHAVHQQGILHRDIKPENIMMDAKAQPVLLDFGNAIGGAGTKPALGFHAVSRHFAAPEQYANDQARMGPWTDIYALCGLLYFCLSGKRPADSNHRIASPSELQRLATLAPSTPPLLLEAIEQGLSLDEQQRPATIEALLKLLAPLRPRAFHWIQALPMNGFGNRMRRIETLLDSGISQPRQWNWAAAAFQWYWLYAQRLPGPATALAAVVVGVAAVGLWWQQFPLAIAVALIGGALFCATYGDLIRYRRIATIGAGLQVSSTLEHEGAQRLLGNEGVADRRRMLVGFLVPFALVAVVELIELREAGVRQQVLRAMALGGLREQLQLYFDRNNAPALTLEDMAYVPTADNEIKSVTMSDGVVHLTLAVPAVDNYRLHLRPRVNASGRTDYVCEAYDFPTHFLPPECTQRNEENLAR
jgi:serine/threonine protein kinase